MFDQQSTRRELPFPSLLARYSDVEQILSQIPQLPVNVKSAQSVRVFERVLDEEELDRITNQDSVSQSDADAFRRIQHRRNTLEPFLGAHLTCLVVRMPGVCFTIEIDRPNETVIHWEWQASSDASRSN